jgi:hypothetical protein
MPLSEYFWMLGPLYCEAARYPVSERLFHMSLRVRWTRSVVHCIITFSILRVTLGYSRPRRRVFSGSGTLIGTPAGFHPLERVAAVA